MLISIECKQRQSICVELILPVASEGLLTDDETILTPAIYRKLLTKFMSYKIKSNSMQIRI